MTGVTDQELSVAAGRVADRLRVVGPRYAARQAPEAAHTLDRIAGLVQQLADLAADAADRPRRPVPRPAAHALGEQLLVLTGDVLSECDPSGIERARAVLGEIADIL